MKWPRGKYNGKRIIGFSVDFKFTVDYWTLKFMWNIGNKSLHIGPFHWHFELVYGFFR